MSIGFNFLNFTGEVELYPLEEKESTELRLRNVISHTRPLIIHGNGHSKIKLNSLGNYLAHSWTPEEGCLHCKWGHIDLQSRSNANYPSVLIAIFIESPTPFLEEQLLKVHDLEYPKERIHLFIHNAVSALIFEK